MPEVGEDFVLSPHQQMLSAGAGSVVVSLFMTPLDVVKIRLQAQERFHAKKCFLYSNGLMDHLCPRTNGDPPARALHTAQEICDCKWYNRPRYFNGTLDAMLKISRMEGVSSLWSGLSPTLVSAIPLTVTYFTMYEQLKIMINNKRITYSGPETRSTGTSEAPGWVALTAGGLARFLVVTIVSPLELIRTKMQSQKMPWSDVTKCLRLLVRSQGVSGLWNGYTATLLRDVPFSALYWPLYEHSKYLLTSFYSSANIVTAFNHNFIINFLSGALAGSVASTVTLPFDVIKTLKQIEMGEKDIMRVRPGVARSNTTIARELVAEQGIRALFSGLTPRLLKVAPACAIMISSYEGCKEFFRKQNIEQ